MKLTEDDKSKRVLKGRAPHGARGLKLGQPFYQSQVTASRPTRGAWIETAITSAELRPRKQVAPHTGRVD